MAKNTNTDQIRQLTNKVHLAGALAELEKKTGTDKNGTAYISLQGAVQCGETPVHTIRFRAYVPAKKSDGTDSKNYPKVVEWANKAVPMTKSKDNCTFVDMVGSLTDNPYVASDGTLVESYQYNITLFSNFTDYAAEIDVEGFVHSIVD